jgi:folate-dependent phosphoribosylglycinamide formyltransferase PurN
MFLNLEKSVTLNMKKWIALFSQTGSEICNISEEIGRYPDIVLTDNVKGYIDERLIANTTVLRRDYKPLSKDEKKKYYTEYFDNSNLHTLHGWLNIVPVEVCKEFTIYNGHPGLITYYPELKGKDPQVRVWDSICKYMYVGSVIHKVTPVVDDGEVVASYKMFGLHCIDLESTFEIHKKTSLISWINFLNTLK